ncbi:lysine-rich nucleolar protein 1 [Dunckerocampus dactyliophorus]|uniref:lysine-rich nucleolar protein 1 n=1 Tax=Dunckerocampus dactyliophorus TaxID=161453 RepID=UPI0024051C5C|nr:lysine-rich nucleolar protein 1 [Dunckerocampus dactyliophorus]
MKVEDEAGENLEEKKPKKRQTLLCEIANATDDKKKTKVKKQGLTMKVDECWEGGGVVQDKKMKKKKKSDSLNQTNVPDVMDGNDKKGNKKKIKKKEMTDRQVGTEVGPVKEEEKSPKKKLKNKTKHENVIVEEEEVAKKAKKERKRLISTNNSEVADDKGVFQKKECLKHAEQKNEKKKKRIKDKGTQMKHEHVKEEEDGEKVPKKGKKKTKNVASAEEQMKHKTKRKKDTAEKEEIIATKKKKQVQLAEHAVASDTVDRQEIKEVKRKKKKNKAGKVQPDADVQEEEKPAKNKESRTTPKKKAEKAKRKSSVASTEEEMQSTKKKKKQKVEEPTCLEVEDNEPSKKSKKKSSDQKAAERKSAKKKIKEEMEEQLDALQVDVVFLSEKTGNTDEVTINPERRQALQMEIDKASQPEQAKQPTRFSQWGTAQFESSEQQHKFLRLIGGFKQGFQSASATVSTARTNMALCKDAQEHLQQGLMREFQHAHTRRMDSNLRGAGLGFSAPSQKKFSIDINACRSVRFDD